MALFLLLILLIVLAVGGLGLFAYGLDRPAHRKNWRYMAGGVLCIGLPAVVNVAIYLEAKERALDPWECVHTHPEEQCHAPPMHGCWTVEVCDLKRLRDAGGKD